MIIQVKSQRTTLCRNAGVGTVGSPRILVVEDEKAVRGVLKRILTTDQYQVTTAENAEEAKNIMEAGQFDILLSDINLPKSSGMELMQYCRQKNPRTEIILITGQPHLADAVSSIKDGAFDYLAKPVDSDKLRSLVKSALVARDKRLQAMDESTMLAAEIVKLKSYRMIRTIGSGHFGTVFLAEKDGAKYAVKILRQSADPKLVKRFLREGEIVTRINHAGLVKIFEYGFDPDKAFPYIVMEFVDGRPLIDLIRRDILTLTEKLEMLRQIALPLVVVHKHGVVHRDIKPGNILLAKDTPKLTDFGVAHLCDSTLTMTLEMIGSPAYMSPEAFSGSKDIDHRADLFSLGVLGYELLTGLLPFHGANFPAIAFAVTHQRPVAPSKLRPNIPPEVEEILARMMEKNPADRFQDAGEIVTALEHCLAGTHRRPPSTWRKLFARQKWE